MQTDSLKLVFTYLVAVIIIIGGGLMLFYSRNEGNSDFALLLAGFIGSAMTFVFGQESATRAVRSYQSGLNTTIAQPVDPVTAQPLNDPTVVLPPANT